MKALRSATARPMADVLARARKQKSLSQRALAAFLKRPHSVAGIIESHQHQVNVYEFIAIAEALHANPVGLLRQVLRRRAVR